MPDFVVLRVSKGQVPGLGESASADAYRGDHPTEIEAVNAAAEVLKPTPGVFLYAVPQSALTRYAVSYATVVG